MSVKALRRVYSKVVWQTINWREDNNAQLTGRFAAVKVHYARGNVGKARFLPQQWQLIEWPEGQVKTEKYYLSTLPDTMASNDLVRTAQMCWRIERDYQDKTGIGLEHYKGRGWRGFHHHASMSSSLWVSVASSAYWATALVAAGSVRDYICDKVRLD